MPTDPYAEHGRGLFLVNSLADTWGVERTGCGPAVYFTLEWDPTPAARKPRAAHRLQAAEAHR